MANVGKDLLQVPFPEMVKAMATGIAEAQLALDMTSLRIAKLMSGAPDPEASTEAEKKKNLVKFHGGEYSLLELGFTPTFYQFTEATLDVSFIASMQVAEALTVGFGVQVSGQIGSADQAAAKLAELDRQEKSLATEMTQNRDRITKEREDLLSSVREQKDDFDDLLKKEAGGAGGGGGGAT